MDLDTLQRILFKEGLTAISAPRDEEFDADRVEVALDTEGFVDPIVLQITQIETDPDDLPDMELIQIYAPIPVPVEEDAVDEILAVLPDVNEAVPLIGFNLHLEDRFVYYRHVMLVPTGKIGLQVAKEGVWLAHFALDAFAGGLARMAQFEEDVQDGTDS
jgi:hypothetical protein